MRFRSHDRLFHWVNNLLLTAAGFTMLAPILHLAALSLSSPRYAGAKQVYFWPKEFNLNVYETIFGMNTLWRAMGVSAYITVFGTLITLALTTSLAFALSRPRMPCKGLILKGIVLTFIFSVPLIPSYLLVKSLHLDNTLWALMLPGALSAFYVFIMRTFFRGISSELFDAAKIDGCGEPGLYGRITIPLSAPVVATIALFHAVSQWNAYFAALIYIRDRGLLPLQVLLRNLVIEEGLMSVASINQSYDLNVQATPEMVKAGIILFATLPILVVYPFLQKYFVKGAMLGSLKE